MMESFNYIPEWYKKFGNDQMQEFLEQYKLDVDSHIFRFKPNNLLDKIKNSQDLFAFAQYINGDFSSKLVSYYSAECNRFYQDREKKPIETAYEDFEDNEFYTLIWENVQDISENVLSIQDTMDNLKDNYNILKKISNILTNLSRTKTQRNAKYEQVEEVKRMIQEIEYKDYNVNDFSFYQLIKDKKIIVIIFLYSLFMIVLGGWLL